MPASDRAVHSLGYNPLTYADPTGAEVVRRLEGDVTISWPDGFTVRISRADSGPISRFLETVYLFRMSRKGHIWATKKKAPADQAGASPKPTSTKE